MQCISLRFSTITHTDIPVPNTINATLLLNEMSPKLWSPPSPTQSGPQANDCMKLMLQSAFLPLLNAQCLLFYHSLVAICPVRKQVQSNPVIETKHAQSSELHLKNVEINPSPPCSSTTLSTALWQNSSITKAEHFFLLTYMVVT